MDQLTPLERELLHSLKAVSDAYHRDTSALQELLQQAVSTSERLQARIDTLEQRLSMSEAFTKGLSEQLSKLSGRLDHILRP
jgi:ABC-type transporter Mla subunit MlaD